jgi:ATP/ADP translocase
MESNPLLFIQNFPFGLVIKIFFLFLIGLFFIFSFVIYTNVKSLNKSFFIARMNASRLMELAAFIYLLATLSLFLLALAIL